MTDNYLLIGVGILIFIDIGFDLFRIWNQNALENWMRAIDKKLAEILIELDGKTKQLLAATVAVADAAGYKRGREELEKNEKR